MAVRTTRAPARCGPRRSGESRRAGSAIASFSCSAAGIARSLVVTMTVSVRSRHRAIGATRTSRWPPRPPSTSACRDGASPVRPSISIDDGRPPVPLETPREGVSNGSPAATWRIWAIRVVPAAIPIIPAKIIRCWRPGMNDDAVAANTSPAHPVAVASPHQLGDGSTHGESARRSRSRSPSSSSVAATSSAQSERRNRRRFRRPRP